VKSLPPELSRLFDSVDAGAKERNWAAFVSRYNRLLLHAGHAYGDDYDSAMDRYAYVLEELRRNDFKRLRAYAISGRGRFSTWLIAVARRLCLDYGRRKYGRDRGQSGRAAHEARAARRRLADLMGVEIDISVIPDSSGANPEAELRRAELLEALQSGIEALDPREQLLLKLRFQDDLSVREITRVMRFPSVFHVYRRLDIVYKSLRRTLLRHGVDDASP